MADLRIVDAPVLLQESITGDVKMPTGGLGNFSIRLGDIVWYVVTKEQLANKNYVDLSSKGVKDSLDEHIADKANPHQVTKEQVGLGNVDNTADIDKPVSNAVNSAIITATTDMATKSYVNQKDNLKADKATTLSGYSIADAYTKAETYNKEEVDSRDGDLTTLITSDKTNLVKAINEVYDNTKGVVALYDKSLELGVDGWSDTMVIVSENVNQRQINDGLDSIATMLAIDNPRNGQRVYVKSYNANKGVGGGFFVYSNTSTTVVDNVVTFGIGSVGRWVRQVEKAITPYDAGAVDNTDATVELERYFSWVTANPLAKINVIGVFNTVRPLNFQWDGTSASWDLKLTATTAMNYMLAMQSYNSKHTGKITLVGTGTTNIWSTMTVNYGLVVNGMQGSTLPFIFASKFKYYGVTMDEGNVVSTIPLNGASYRNNTMLELLGITARDCGGSMWTGWSNIKNTVNYSNPVHTGTSGTSSQATTLTLDANPIAGIDTSVVAVFAIINNRTYKVNSFDTVNNTVSVFPWLEKDEPVTGNIYFFFGAAFANRGSNGGPTKLGGIDAIRCGTGLLDMALYGGNSTSVTAQSCVVGITVGSIPSSVSPQSSKHIGVYTELVYRSLLTIGSGGVAIDNRFGEFATIDPLASTERIRPNNRNGDYGAFADSLGYSRVNIIGANGDNNKLAPLYYKGKALNVYNQSTAFNIKSNDVILKTYKRNSVTFNLVNVDSSNTYCGLDEAQVIVVGTGTNNAPTGALTFNPPNGWTVNGTTQYVMSGFTTVAYVLVYFEFNTKNVIVTSVTPLTTQLITTATYDPPSLATATQQSTSVTLTGAKLGDTVTVSFNKALNGTRLWAEVTVADTVTVYHRNDTGVAVDIASGTLTVKIV